MKGFTFPYQPLKEQKEVLSVQCRRCRNVWQEEVTHYGIFAGYARYYDCCEKCLTEDEKKKFGISEEDIPDDVCCCGDSMENHDSPINCGHSPVSMRDYYLAGKKDESST